MHELDEELIEAGGEVAATLRAILEHPAVKSVPGLARALVTAPMGPSRITPLMICASRCFGRGVQEVLAVAAVGSSDGSSGGTAVAVQSGGTSDLEALYAVQAAASGRTALHMAVAMCDVGTVEALLAKEAVEKAVSKTVSVAESGAVSGAGDALTAAELAGVLPGQPPAVIKSVAVTLEDFAGQTPLDVAQQNLVAK